MKYSLLTIALAFGILSNAQQLVSEVGRVSTKFKYTNSDNEELGNLYSINDFSYALGYRMTLAENVYVRAGVVFNKYNNEGSDPVYDNKYVWKTNYIGINITPEYQFLNIKNMRFLAIGSFEPQFMTRGSQTTNRQIIDLKKIEQFEKPFLFLKGGLGANYCLDEKVALTIKYLLGRGTPLGETEGDETLKINSGTFTIGLLWGIKGCEYCKIKRH